MQDGEARKSKASNALAVAALLVAGVNLYSHLQMMELTKGMGIARYLWGTWAVVSLGLAGLLMAMAALHLAFVWPRWQALALMLGAFLVQDVARVNQHLGWSGLDRGGYTFGGVGIALILYGLASLFAARAKAR